MRRLNIASEKLSSGVMYECDKQRKALSNVRKIRVTEYMVKLSGMQY